MTNDHPIVMQAASVRAIIEGRKTQTRRLIPRLKRFRKVTEFQASTCPGYDWTFRDHAARWHEMSDGSLKTFLPWRVGERLWVREAWQFYDWTEDGDPCVRYAADDSVAWPDAPEEFSERLQEIWAELSDPCASSDDRACDKKWRSPIHMPRWASRLTLEVTDVRIQRVQEITDADAVAEGITQTASGAWSAVEGYSPLAGTSAVGGYYCLWNSIHGDGAWQSNPFVAAISFRAIKSNIGAQEAQAA